jgi:malonyl-CoA O-methyltransferase
MQGLFVTGSDTGIGKTVVSAALALRTGFGYWKPIQTGPESDTATVQTLAGCRTFDQGVRLRDPVSPHLAAERTGVRINLNDLVAQAPNHDSWIVEGAGGVLVPVNDQEKMIDLMVLLALPIVVAASTKLGTINHTLLTLDALRSRALRVELVVMSGPPNPDNRAAIENFGRVPVIEMPWFDPLTPEKLKQWAL